MAQAARNAALAASRRPRPSYKFEEETNAQPQGSNRKLSYGETSVAPMADFEANPIQGHGMNTDEMASKRLKLGNGQYHVANSSEAQQAFEQIKPQHEANPVFHTAPTMNNCELQCFESGVQLNQAPHIPPAASSSVPSQAHLATALLNSRKRSFAETAPFAPQAAGPSLIMGAASGSGWGAEGFEGNNNLSLPRSTPNGLFQCDSLSNNRDSAEVNQTSAHLQPSDFEITFNGSNGLQVTTSVGAPEASHAPHSQLPYGWIGKHDGHSEIPTVIRTQNGMTTAHAPNPSEVNRVIGDGKEEEAPQAGEYSPESAEERPLAKRLQSVQALHNTSSGIEAPEDGLLSGVAQDDMDNNQKAEPRLALAQITRDANGNEEAAGADDVVAREPSKDETSEGIQVPNNTDLLNLGNDSNQEAETENVESATPAASGAEDEITAQSVVPTASQPPSDIQNLNLASPREQPQWMTLGSLASGDLENGALDPFALPSASSTGFDALTPRFFDSNPGEDL